MARLIDADAFRKHLEVDKYGQINTTITKINIAIEKAKVEAEPVKHGKWIYTGFMEVKCNNCGNVFHELEDTNYCPHCGYKMDLVEVEE